MKNGNFAIYEGKEYSADYFKGKGILLRSQNIEDLEKGFQKYDGYNKEIICIKYVDRLAVSSFYRARTRVRYKGYEFSVVEETDNELSIVTMVGDYRVWEGLGMECIDRGVYQKWIKKEEAEKIWIEKGEL